MPKLVKMQLYTTNWCANVYQRTFCMHPWIGHWDIYSRVAVDSWVPVKYAWHMMAWHIAASEPESLQNCTAWNRLTKSRNVHKQSPQLPLTRPKSLTLPVTHNKLGLMHWTSGIGYCIYALVLRLRWCIFVLRYSTMLINRGRRKMQDLKWRTKCQGISSVATGGMVHGNCRNPRRKKFA